MREKILILSNKLQTEKIVKFRLYNALYIITSNNNLFNIRQYGINRTYTYSSLNELLTNFIIYGSNLIESVEDIKYID